MDPRWALPHVTGLPGVLEGFCPPHFPNMCAAVAAFVLRKFGPGGPFHPATPVRIGIVPSLFMLTYLQAHHLDLGFYDTHFTPGARLETHRRHMEDWH